MTAVEHIIAWIESSRPHYDKLLDIYRRRQPEAGDCFIRPSGLAAACFNLATSAYSEMIRGGDAWAGDHSAGTILDAAKALSEWELEE